MFIARNSSNNDDMVVRYDMLLQCNHICEQNPDELVIGFSFREEGETQTTKFVRCLSNTTFLFSEENRLKNLVNKPDFIVHYLMKNGEQLKFGIARNIEVKIKTFDNDENEDIITETLSFILWYNPQDSMIHVNTLSDDLRLCFKQAGDPDDICEISREYIADMVKW